MSARESAARADGPNGTSGDYVLYIHVPFCAPAKCPYCDFYSLPVSRAAIRDYLEAVRAAALRYAPRLAGRRAASVYFGGGTPVLLGDVLAELLVFLKQTFDVAPDAEVTVEANPGLRLSAVFGRLRAAGANRLSIGMQSACLEELRALGRRHAPADVRRTVEEARAAGFANLSLDLMLATPGQTVESIRQSANFAAGLGVQHVSAYLLKVEPGTAFARAGRREADEDTQAACYEAACDALEAHGFAQYEISNFAQPGFESRHNLRYWDCGEYLGLGPGAHAFLFGRRFHFAPDLAAFAAGAQPVDDGAGGSFEEYVMLRLRLADGLAETGLRARTGRGFEALAPGAAERLAKGGFLRADNGRLALTRKGFLVSNAVIGALLFGGG